MTSPSGAPARRRPLPALVFLLALTVLAALVWWRVLDHSDDHAVASPACTPAPSPTATAPTQLPQQAAITVQVLNSTTRQGIAGKAQLALSRDGFRTPAAADNDGKTYPGYAGEVKGVATIRYGAAGRSGAQLLGYYFPGATLARTSATDATVYVSLGLKYKAVATAAQVHKALDAAGIKLVPVSGAIVTQPSSSSCPPAPRPTSS